MLYHFWSTISLLFYLTATNATPPPLPSGSLDPCAKIAGKAFVPPADALACQKSFPFDEGLRQNVLNNIARVLDFFTFENYYLNSPPPFQESTNNIRKTLARINSTRYATDYDFNWDVYQFTTQLNDGHTRWVPDCYTSFQNILPAPVVSLAAPTPRGGTEQGVYIAPDSPELLAQLGTEFASFFASPAINFNYTRLAGARVLKIAGQDPYDYIDFVARTVSGNYLDHGLRVNSVFTGYRIVGTKWSQRLGDLAGPIGVAQTSLQMQVQIVGSKRAETVTIPFLAKFGGVAFTDRESFWMRNCKANEATNGVDRKTSAATFSGGARKMRKAEILGAAQRVVIDLPSSFIPKLPPVNGSAGVIKSFILPDKKTGVMFVGSFVGDFDGFQSDVVAAVTQFKAAGVSQLLLDLTSNGGGYVCLSQFLQQYLTGSNSGQPGFVTSIRASALAQKVLAADIALGLDKDLALYTADNWAFLNGTRMPASYNYMIPTVPKIVNGKSDPVSQHFYDTCTDTFSQAVPKTPPFDLNKVAIVTNGNCASSCAHLSTAMYERHRTKIAVFGGKPGEDIEFKGVAGAEVFSWVDIDSEIKTAGLKNDPLAPPDLFVSATFVHNWRTAWSYLDKKKPIAYVSELPKYRFPYTANTYNNPQNLWTFAAKKMF